MSVREQCRLLGVPRSTVYYEPCGPKASDLAVMRRLDEQYTATPFYGVERMTAAGVTISMDGRGRAFDNIFTERLWRSVKYEEVYLKDYVAVDDARAGLGDYFGFCNTARPHQALGYRTPAELHFGDDCGRCNKVTGANKKEKEAKRKKTLLLQNTTLKN